MTVEERVWIALAKPRTSRQVYTYVNKKVESHALISWERIEQALNHWLSTGMVHVTNRRFWRNMNIHRKDANVE